MRVTGKPSKQTPAPATPAYNDPCDPQQLRALGIGYGRGWFAPPGPRPTKPPPEPSGRAEETPTPPPEPKPVLRPLEYPVLEGLVEVPGMDLAARMRIRGLVYFPYPHSRWAPPGTFKPYVEPRPELRRDAGLAQGAGGERPRPPEPPPKPPTPPPKVHTDTEKSLGYGLSAQERAERGLSPMSTLRPALPKPAPAMVKELESIVSEPPPPPVRHPAPGTKGAACELAGHDIWYDPKGSRWRCRTHDAERFRKTHPRKGQT